MFQLKDVTVEALRAALQRSNSVVWLARRVCQDGCCLFEFVLAVFFDITQQAGVQDAWGGSGFGNVATQLFFQDAWGGGAWGPVLKALNFVLL